MSVSLRIGPRGEFRHAYLVAGQSNAVGSGASDMPDVPIRYRRARGTGASRAWYTMVGSEGLDGGAESGPWHAFCQAHIAAGHGRPLIIMTAVGGTSLSATPFEWLVPNGVRYVNSIDQWTALGRPKITAVLWHQGEYDASQGVSTATYQTALEDLADAYWSRLRAPMVVAPLTTRSPHDSTHANVRAAIEAAAATRQHIHIGPEHDDLALDAGAHIQDTNTLGARWFAAVQDAVLP